MAEAILNFKADAIEHGLSYRESLAYSIAQVAGGIAGTLLAHTMFGLSFDFRSRITFAADRHSFSASSSLRSA